MHNLPEGLAIGTDTSFRTDGSQSGTGNGGANIPEEWPYCSPGGSCVPGRVLDDSLAECPWDWGPLGAKFALYPLCRVPRFRRCHVIHSLDESYRPRTCLRVQEGTLVPLPVSLSV